MFWSHEVYLLDSEEEPDPLGFWPTERDLLSSLSPLGLIGERTGDAGCLEDLSGDDDLLISQELGPLVVSG